MRKWIQGAAIHFLFPLIAMGAINTPDVLSLPGEPAQSTPGAVPLTAAERGVIYEAAEFYGRADYAAARKTLESAIRKFPDSYEARYLYSTTLVQLNDYREAAAVFDWLLQRNSGDYRVLNNYSWMLATASDPGLRDPARALALAQEAILHAPAHSSIWNTLAEAHYINGNFDRAVTAMEHSLELASREPGSQMKIPDYQVQLVKMRRAAEVMRLLE